MNASWFTLPVGAVAGAVGAGVTLLWAVRRRPERGGAPQDHRPDEPAEPEPGGWTPELHRCRQAVHRARTAANAATPAAARDGLLVVVHRMDAELLSVEALTELGRSMRGAQAERNAQVLHRVRENLEAAATGFAEIAESVAGLAARLGPDAELEQVYREIAGLRERFPLLEPMSAVLAPPARDARLRPLPLPGS